MRNCDHIFISFRYLKCKQRLICVYCGQIREVYEDGTIIVKQHEGNVKYDQPKYTAPNTGGTGPQLG